MLVVAGLEGLDLLGGRLEVSLELDDLLVLGLDFFALGFEVLAELGGLVAGRGERFDFLECFFYMVIVLNYLWFDASLMFICLRNNRR